MIDWTPDMLDELHRLRAAGVTLYRCAERIGVSYGVVCHKARELQLNGRMSRGHVPGTMAVANTPRGPHLCRRAV